MPNKRTSTDVRKEVDAARAARDWPKAESLAYEATWLAEHEQSVARQAREAAAATATVAQISTRAKELQERDAKLTPPEQAVFRSRHAGESEANGRRIGELNKSRTASAVDPMAVQRARARATLNTLQNPMQRAAFLEKYGELVWGEGDEPDGGGKAA